jgi:phosphodiesterase/alkaline phosphatase D-like protein
VKTPGTLFGGFMRKLLILTLGLALMAGFAYASPQAAYQQAGRPGAQQVTMKNGPRVEFTDPDEVVIGWATNVDARPSDTVLRYGTNPRDPDQTAQTEDTKDKFWHRVHIHRLAPNTRYYVQILARQPNGSMSPIGNSQFETKAGTSAKGEREDNDEGPLRLSKAPRVEFLGWDSAVIAWGTSDDVKTGETRLKWGTNSNALDQTAQTENAGKDFWHRAHLRGLRPDTTYYYQIVSPKGPLGQVEQIHTNAKTDARNKTPYQRQP